MVDVFTLEGIERNNLFEEVGDKGRGGKHAARVVTGTDIQRRRHRRYRNYSASQSNSGLRLRGTGPHRRTVTGGRSGRYGCGPSAVYLIVRVPLLGCGRVRRGHGRPRPAAAWRCPRFGLRGYGRSDVLSMTAVRAWFARIHRSHPHPDSVLRCEFASPGATAVITPGLPAVRRRLEKGEWSTARESLAGKRGSRGIQAGSSLSSCWNSMVGVMIRAVSSSSTWTAGVMVPLCDRGAG
ncbi:hypothetical protein ABIA39_005730 [Nocardia sp. GAS34]